MLCATVECPGGSRRVKLMLMIVQDYDAPELIRHLVEGGFRVTQVSSTGGFLRAGNTTLMLGVEDSKVTRVLEVVSEHCSERIEVIRPTAVADLEEWYPPDQVEVEVGGATIFVLEVQRFERIH